MSLNVEMSLSVQPGRSSLGPKNTAAKLWPWTARLYDHLIPGDGSYIISYHSLFHLLHFFEHTLVFQLQDFALAAPSVWGILPADMHEALLPFTQVFLQMFPPQTGLC